MKFKFWQGDMLTKNQDNQILDRWTGMYYRFTSELNLDEPYVEVYNSGRQYYVFTGYKSWDGCGLLGRISEPTLQSAMFKVDLLLLDLGYEVVAPFRFPDFGEE